MFAEGKHLASTLKKDQKTGDTERFVYKSINIAGVPIFIIIIGLFIWRKRIARRKFIQKEFSGEVTSE